MLIMVIYTAMYCSYMRLHTVKVTVRSCSCPKPGTNAIDEIQHGCGRVSRYAGSAVGASVELKNCTHAAE